MVAHIAGLERTHGTSIWYMSELSSSQRVLLGKILALRKEQLELSKARCWSHCKSSFIVSFIHQKRGNKIKIIKNKHVIFHTVANKVCWSEYLSKRICYKVQSKTKLSNRKYLEEKGYERNLSTRVVYRPNSNPP